MCSAKHAFLIGLIISSKASRGQYGSREYTLSIDDPCNFERITLRVGREKVSIADCGKRKFRLAIENIFENVCNVVVKQRLEREKCHEIGRDRSPEKIARVSVDSWGIFTRWFLTTPTLDICLFFLICDSPSCRVQPRLSFNSIRKCRARILLLSINL